MDGGRGDGAGADRGCGHHLWLVHGVAPFISLRTILFELSGGWGKQEQRRLKVNTWRYETYKSLGNTTCLENLEFVCAGLLNAAQAVK